MTCCGGSEATVHRNTWQQGRRWSDLQELGSGVEGELLGLGISVHDHHLQLESVEESEL